MAYFFKKVAVNNGSGKGDWVRRMGTADGTALFGYTPYP
jgi:hypothetical protein